MSYRNPVRQVGVAGTVEVTGTVATSGGSSGGTTSAIRTAKTFTASGNTFKITAPTDTKAADLIVMVLSFYETQGTGYAEPVQTGWTEAEGFSRGFGRRRVFTRIADAGDVNGARSYDFNLVNTQRADSYPMGVVNAFGGVNKYATDAITPSSTGQANLTLPSYASPKIALCWAVAAFSTSTSTSIPATTWTSSTAPASPQPTWKGDRIRPTSPVDGAIGMFAAEAPTTAGSYGIRQTTGDDNVSNNWDFITAILSKA